ncbi:MAG: AraC family transcriptional regulator [Sulfitobacter sp.]
MSSQYERRILRVLTYIHDNPGEDLSLDQLAEVAAMSRFHWHRVFQAMTGETCAQAVRRLRMFRAANWLLHTSWPVEKIARSVGYPNVNSFSRVFREEIGSSPKVFQKSGKFTAQLKPKRTGDHKMFDVEIKTTPAHRLAAMKHTGAYTKIGGCFEKIAQIATMQGLWAHSGGLVRVHYDDPNVVPEPELRSYAGLILKADVALPEGLEEVRLTGGTYAVLRYKGPYTGIGVAYDHLFGRWLPESDKEPADAPAYEMYLNTPQDTAQEELLTEIYLPLAA